MRSLLDRSASPATRSHESPCSSLEEGYEAQQSVRAHEHASHDVLVQLAHVVDELAVAAQAVVLAQAHRRARRAQPPHAALVLEYELFAGQLPPGPLLAGRAKTAVAVCERSVDRRAHRGDPARGVEPLIARALV